MNHKGRIAKLERAIDPNACPVCGADIRPQPELRPTAEERLTAYLAAGANREEAEAYLSEDGPSFARALGVFRKPVGRHFCVGCGADRRSAVELARSIIARYLPFVGGHDDAALALLREDWPEGAALLTA